MGYTHYWQQFRSFTADEWAQLCADMRDLLKDVEHVQGIPLANWDGEPGTAPEIGPDRISFNGVGDDSHESFVIDRRRPALESWQTPDRRGAAFCKTARKPYDLAVTAALCYLGTVIDPKPWHVSSDGRGANWLPGLEEARRAIPRVANVLDIPRGILERDRWCPPWITNRSPAFDFRFCVDGRAYITRKRDGAAYCFPSHREAAEWARPHADVLCPTGWFDAARWRRIASAQTRLFRPMVESAPRVGRDHRPPALVRPGEILPPERTAYSLADLLRAAA